MHSFVLSYFFFFHDTATTEIYTLSIHDALPISAGPGARYPGAGRRHSARQPPSSGAAAHPDRKSTRLNSSHITISYAVCCLKKKKKRTQWIKKEQHKESPKKWLMGVSEW